MKIMHMLAVLSTVLLIGCAVEEETYPLTGAPCGPDDPVKDMSASDCTPL
ncbi:MAG: hypothetical protein QNJ44_09070 [Rhodobacter sp.]|nr:hypothetical protein [Rhodobacter sp.]